MAKLTRLLAVVAIGASALVLAGCARDRVREEPHHFSKDTRGNRIACYTTEVANEYECVPVYRNYGYAYPYPHYYDPFWSAGFLYGWPHYQVIVVEQPPPANPPPHWRPRPKKR